MSIPSPKTIVARRIVKTISRYVNPVHQLKMKILYLQQVSRDDAASDTDRRNAARAAEVVQSIIDNNAQADSDVIIRQLLVHAPRLASVFDEYNDDFQYVHNATERRERQEKREAERQEKEKLDAKVQREIHCKAMQDELDRVLWQHATRTRRPSPDDTDEAAPDADSTDESSSESESEYYGRQHE